MFKLLAASDLTILEIIFLQLQNSNEWRFLEAAKLDTQIMLPVFLISNSPPLLKKETKLRFVLSAYRQ